MPASIPALVNPPWLVWARGRAGYAVEAVATQRTIALLKERRAALIAAAVTGKIDLQGVGCQTGTVVDDECHERRPQ